MTHTFLVFLELVPLDFEVENSSVLRGDLVFRRVGPHVRIESAKSEVRRE